MGSPVDTADQLSIVFVNPEYCEFTTEMLTELIWSRSMSQVTGDQEAVAFTNYFVLEHGSEKLIVVTPRADSEDVNEKDVR
jgi:hypothetical protein